MMSRKDLFLFLGSVAWSLLFFELFLRFCDYPPVPIYGWSGIFPPPSNSMKGDKKFRVLLLGDSQVTTRWSPQDPLPGESLQSELNSIQGLSDKGTRCGTLPSYPVDIDFEVDTLGAIGWGQDQQLLHLADVLRSGKYDLVLLWFTPENDIWNNAFPTHYPLNGAGKPTFVLNSSGEIILAAKEEITGRLLDSQIRLYALFLRGVSNVMSFFARRDPSGRSFGLSVEGNSQILVTADQYWHEKYMMAYQQNTGASPNQLGPVTKFALSRADLKRFNPYSLVGPIEYQKSHFAIATSPDSSSISYMVDLTAELVKKIKAIAALSHADFAGFWYDASQTLQPLYPEDGFYEIEGVPLQFCSSCMKSRLEKIFKGTNHGSFFLQTPKWRGVKNDPHLSVEANRELMNSLAVCLKRIN